MWKYVGFAVAGTAMILASESALAQKKGASKLASPQEYQMINNQPQLQGEIVSVGLTSVTVRTTFTSMQPNPNFKPVNNQNNQNVQNQVRAAQQQQQQAAAQMAMAQAKLQSAQTPQQRQQAQQQLAQAQNRLRQVQVQRPPQQRIQLPNPNNQPFKQVQESKEFELPLADAVTVRKAYLGTEYDNTTGKLKQHTPEEIRKLKGSDPSKPGYSAKLDDIQTGHQATVYLTAARNAKSVNKDAPADRPTVHMIMLTAEMAAFNAAGAPKKK